MKSLRRDSRGASASQSALYRFCELGRSTGEVLGFADRIRVSLCCLSWISLGLAVKRGNWRHGDHHVPGGGFWSGGTVGAHAVQVRGVGGIGRCELLAPPCGFQARYAEADRRADQYFGFELLKLYFFVAECRLLRLVVCRVECDRFCSQSERFCINVVSVVCMEVEGWWILEMNFSFLFEIVFVLCGVELAF